MVQEWIIQTLSNRATNQVILEVHDNYLEKGVIDSFGLMEFIEEIEQNFSIQFSNSEFSDRRFVTISGLTEIITSKMNA